MLQSFASFAALFTVFSRKMLGVLSLLRNENISLNKKPAGFSIYLQGV